MSRARRRPDHRCRSVRDRRRGAADPRAPRPELRGPRATRGQRRDVGPVPLPRHPVGLRHVHPRLPVQAVARRTGARRRPGDPRLRPRDRAGVRRGPADPLRHRVDPRRLGLRHRTVDRGGGDRRRAAPLTTTFLWSCSGYYDYDEGYTPEFPASTATGPDRPPPAVAGGPRLPRQARRGDRQRRDRGDAGAGDGRDGRGPRDDAAALAHLHPLAAGGTASPGGCADCCRSGRRTPDPVEERADRDVASTS